jgi:hypothetical protein
MTDIPHHRRSPMEHERDTHDLSDEALGEHEARLRELSRDPFGAYITSAHQRRFVKIADTIAALRAERDALRAQLAREREAGDRLAAGLAESYEEQLWAAYNTGLEDGGGWSHMFMSDGEWLAQTLGFDPTLGSYDADQIKGMIPDTVSTHPALAAFRAAREGEG